MDLQTLRFFVASADAGSFSAAAENLHYAQSNLSNRIKQLEEELGEPLFYRHKRGVFLIIIKAPRRFSDSQREGFL